MNLWEKVTLPPELLAQLNGMIRRIRGIQLLRGALAVAAVALLCALAIMAIDAAVVIYSDAVRVGLSLVGLALVAATAWFALVRPLSDRITPVRMARIIETRHPELQERISSALELLGQGGADAASASAQLLGLLAANASEDIASVSAKTEFRGATLRPVVATAATAAGILLLLFLVWPRQSAVLFARAVAPLAPIGNLSAQGLTVAPGDATILQGGTVAFTLTAPLRKATRAELCIERPGEPPSVERLIRQGEDAETVTYGMTLPNVRSSFRYRVRLGTALTRHYAVTVIPPPAHGNLACTLAFPDYTGLAPTQFISAATFPIRVPNGTRATIRTSLNRAMSASLRLGDARVLQASPAYVSEGVRGPAPDPLAIVWEWLALTNSATRWAITLRDASGFTNAPSWAPYEVLPDASPHLLLTYPSGTTYTLPSYGLLKLVFSVRDDYGLAGATLMIQPDNEPTPWTIDCTPAGQPTNVWSVTSEVHLDEFQLGGARKLRIWLEASDSLPPYLGGPNVSKSRIIAVNLDNAQTRSLADQVRIPERESLTNLLAQAAARLEAAAREIQAATNAAAKAESAPEGLAPDHLTAAETAADEAVAVAEKAAEAAREGLFAGLAPKASEVAESAAEKAALAAEVALADPAEQQRLASEAADALLAAAEEARALVPDVLRTDKILEEAAEMENIAAMEQRQAQQATARQFTAPELEEWQKRQDKLAERIEKAAEVAEAREEAVKPLFEGLVPEIEAAPTFVSAEEAAMKPQPAPEGASAQPATQASAQPQPATQASAQPQPATQASAQPQPAPQQASAQPQPSPEGVRGQAPDPLVRADPTTSAPPAGSRTEASKPQPAAASEAAKAAKAASEAAKAAKEAPRDEPALLRAREAESAARRAREAASSAERAARSLSAVEKDRAAMTAIQSEAKTVAEKAAEASDAAMEIRVAAAEYAKEQIPDDIARALGLAQKAQGLAAAAEKAAADAASRAAGEEKEEDPARTAAPSSTNTSQEREALRPDASAPASEGDRKPAPDPLAPSSAPSTTPATLARDAAALAEEAKALREAADPRKDPFLARAAEMAEEAARNATAAADAIRKSERADAPADETRDAAFEGAAKARAAAESAAKAAADADRAAVSPQGQAAVSAKKAEDLAHEAQSLANDLSRAIEANRAPSPTPDEGVREPAPAPLADLAERAETLRTEAEAAAKDAQAAQNAANAIGAGESSRALQQVRDATDKALRAAQAAENAVKSETEGNRGAADGQMNQLNSLAKEAEQRAAEAAKSAAIPAVKPAEHAAEAAARATEAARAVREALDAATKAAPSSAEEGRGGAESTAQPQPATQASAQPQPAPEASAQPASEGVRGQAPDPLVRATEAAKDARAAADATDVSSRDYHESLPPKAACAARDAAAQAEAAAALVQRLADAAAGKPPPPGQQPPNPEQLAKDATAAVERAERAAAKAERAARISGMTPDRQVAEMAREGQLAAKALEEQAAKIAEAADQPPPAAEGGQGESPDLQSFREAVEAADRIAQGAQTLAGEMQPIIDNASRVGDHEAADAARRLQTLFNRDVNTARQLADAARKAQSDQKTGAARARDLGKAAADAEAKAAEVGERFLPADEALARSTAHAEEAADALSDFAPSPPPASEGVRGQAPGRLPTSPADTLREQLSEATRQAADAAHLAADAGHALQQLQGAEPTEPPTTEGHGGAESPFDASTATMPATAQPTASKGREGAESPHDASTATMPATAQPPASEGRGGAESPRPLNPASPIPASEGAWEQAPDPLSTAQAAADSATEAAAAAKDIADRAGKLLSSRLASAEKDLGGAAKASKEVADRAGKLASDESLADIAGQITSATALADQAISALGSAQKASARATAEAAKSSTEGVRGQAPDPLSTAQSAEASGEAQPPQTSGSPSSLFLAPSAEAAREAMRLSDSAIAAARALQAPGEEQLEAARQANKAAQNMRRLAAEHALLAGLDPETMRIKPRSKPAPGDQAGEGKGKANPKKDKGGPGRESDPEDPQPNSEEEDGVAAEMPEWLRKLGFPLSEWLKYRGSLESGMPEGALDKVAPEYRDLVRRYFLLLSKDPAASR